MDFLKFSFFSHKFFSNFDICYYSLANWMLAGSQQSESTTSKQMLTLKLKS